MAFQGLSLVGLCPLQPRLGPDVSLYLKNKYLDGNWILPYRVLTTTPLALSLTIMQTVRGWRLYINLCNSGVVDWHGGLQFRRGGSMIECLPAVHKALGSIPALKNHTKWSSVIIWSGDYTEGAPYTLVDLSYLAIPNTCNLLCRQPSLTSTKIQFPLDSKYSMWRHILGHVHVRSRGFLSCPSSRRLNSHLGTIRAGEKLFDDLESGVRELCLNAVLTTFL